MGDEVLVARQAGHAHRAGDALIDGGKPPGAGAAHAHARCADPAPASRVAGLPRATMNGRAWPSGPARAVPRCVAACGSPPMTLAATSVAPASPPTLQALSRC